MAKEMIEATRGITHVEPLHDLSRAIKKTTNASKKLFEI